MKTKTSELIGKQLDWAVAKALGYTTSDLDLLYDIKSYDKFTPSTNWSWGGPIIERENINLIWTEGYPVRATIYRGGEIWFDAEGQKPLIAAMRCFVRSKLGDEPDIRNG